MLTLLLVDDYDETLESLSLLFRLHPEVQTIRLAHTAEEVWGIIENEAVDIVSLDINLGTDNGLEVCGHIHNQFPEIYILICSLDDSVENRQQATQAGAHKFVAKPMGSQDVNETIQAYRLHQQRRGSSTTEPDQWVQDFLRDL